MSAPATVTARPAADPAKEPRRILSARSLIIAAAGILLWLSLLAFPEPPLVNLDSSWQQAVIYAGRHNLQCGVDYVFTVGPLGRFINVIISWPNKFFVMPHDPGIYWEQFAWELAVNAFLAAVFMIVVLKTRGTLARAVLLALLVVVLPISKDALYLFALCAITALIIDRYPESLLALALGLLFIAAVSLMKFTLMAFAVVCVAAIAASFVLRGRYVRGAIALAGYAAFVACIWVLCGQHLGNFPAYIANSLDITSGYSEAMGKSGPFRQVLAAAAMLLGAGVMGVLSLVGGPLSFRRIAQTAIVAAALFIAWKSGFVRHDLHAFIFFAFALAAVFLIPRPVSGCIVGPAFSVVLYLEVIAGLAGLFGAGKLMGFGYAADNAIPRWRARISHNVAVLTDPREAKMVCDVQTRSLAVMYSMKETKAAVGDGTIDLISYEQQYLFLNGLNWHGRPTIQSYAAYTPRLAAMNGRFFAGPGAPDFVALKLQPIDSRYPMMEDGEALKAILRCYMPLFVEREYLILKRLASPPGETAHTPLLSRTVGIDNWVHLEELGDGPQTLSLGIRYTLLGKLRKLLFRAPIVEIAVRKGPGPAKYCRVVPGMAGAGFVINPYIADQKDLVRWYAGEPMARVGSFKIYVAPKDRKYVKDTVTVEVRKLGFDLPAVSEDVKKRLTQESLPTRR